MIIKAVEHIDDWSWIERKIILGREVVGWNVVSKFLYGYFDSFADFFIIRVDLFLGGKVKSLISDIIYIIYLYLNIQTLKGNTWFDVVDDADIKLKIIFQ